MPFFLGNTTTSSYSDMVDTLNKAGAYVKLGIKIANTDDRVTKFSLLRGTNNEFVLVFSVSHSVVDGDTYYKILNMLREDSKIESLEMERLGNFNTILEDCFGVV